MELECFPLRRKEDLNFQEIDKNSLVLAKKQVLFIEVTKKTKYE